MYPHVMHAPQNVVDAHPEETRRARPKLPSLDGWRAIAILIVLASHMWASTGSPLHGLLWQKISSQGNLGVRIFFTLSGFLITWLLLDEHSRLGEISLRSFYMRRIFRIFPVYYLYLTVLAAAQMVHVYRDQGTTWLGALTFTRNWIGQGDSATGHLWSLAVEEQFYLVWPILLVLADLYHRRRLAWTILGIVIVAAIASRAIPCGGPSILCRTVFHPNSALRYADCLAIGCLGAFLYSRVPSPQALSRVAAPTFALLLVLSTFIETRPGGLGASVLINAQAWIAIAALVFSINAGSGAWFKLLNARPVAFMGVISYSLYIWHVLFLQKYTGAAFPLGIFANWWLWWVAAILLASVSYYGFERPLLKRGKRWRR